MNFVEKTVACYWCGSAVRGYLDYVALSILCPSCCKRATQREVLKIGRFYTIPEADVLEKCELQKDDLNLLNFMVLEKKKHREWNGIRFYLRGEVRYLRNLRRKEKLENVIGFKISSIDDKIRKHILEDYLTETMSSETSFEMVQSRCAVLETVVEIMRQYSWAYAPAAIQFCVECPKACANDFSKRRNKMSEAFRLEGDRILSFVPEECRRDLEKSPLSMWYAEFQKRNRDAMLGTYLSSWFCRQTVHEILHDGGQSSCPDDSSWRWRPWAQGPEDRIAVKLADFWKRRMERKRQLLDALMRRGLSLPKSCCYCCDFMAGDGDYNLKEMTAIVDVRKQLWIKYRIRMESSRGHAALKSLLYHLNALKVGHFLSVRRAVETAAEFPIDEEEDDEDDDWNDDDDEDDDWNDDDDVRDAEDWNADRADRRD